MTDSVSAFWQPGLKALGRAQLDLAGLRSRQARSILDWSAEIMRAQSPLEAYGANVRLWQQLMEQMAEVVAPSMMPGFLLAAEATPELDLPQRRIHDRLQLIDEDEAEDAADYERRVA